MNYLFKTGAQVVKLAFEVRWLHFVTILTLVVAAGCSSTPGKFGPPQDSKPGPVQPEPLRLREGDTVRVEFPGAPNLNTRAQINRDGKIALLAGEVTAAGKTVAELQKELVELYGPQLVTKLVVVSVEVASFPVYVSGAVTRNGRITVDRPITALEAVMEAGVDPAKANLKAVRVTRSSAGRTEVFNLNLDRVLKGRETESKPFYLQPSDIVYVPEKFQWF